MRYYGENVVALWMRRAQRCMYHAL